MSLIPNNFIKFASDIIGNTEYGLSGNQIVENCNSFAIDYNISIPYSTYPFPNELKNKRSALRENLLVFTPSQQFEIIKSLCELNHFQNNNNVRDLKIKLISRYGSLATDNSKSDINLSLIEETKHWLSEYPDVYKLYNECLEKYSNEIYHRNCLDDLRLSLELLLKNVLENKKSLENQINSLGNYINERNASKELNNMLVKLIDYFSKYQNTYVKHNDNINENEIEIILEIASSFMKFMIRINNNKA